MAQEINSILYRYMSWIAQLVRALARKAKGWRMSSAHRIVESSAHSPTFPSLHLRHNSFSNPSIALPTSQLILQSFRCLTYVTDHSPNLSLLLRHSSLPNLSVTSPTSQFILQPSRRVTYVTAHSPTLPLLHLRHSSFSNASFVSPMSQALHLRHLVRRPWMKLN